MQGAIIRAQVSQLNLQVSLFLSDIFHDFENRLLLNDVFIHRNIEENHEGHG